MTGAPRSYRGKCRIGHSIRTTVLPSISLPALLCSGKECPVEWLAIIFMSETVSVFIALPHHLASYPINLMWTYQKSVRLTLYGVRWRCFLHLVSSSTKPFPSASHKQSHTVGNVVIFESLEIMFIVTIMARKRDSSSAQWHIHTQPVAWPKINLPSVLKLYRSSILDIL